MRKWPAIILIFLAGTGVAFGQGTDSASLSGQLYSPIHFTMPIEQSAYRNPFDNDDIELIGIFQSPGGEQFVIPGFWMQPYQNTCDEPCFELEPEGDPEWQVRFTPQETGEWSYTLQVRDNGTIIDVRDGRFTVEPSDGRGFVRPGENGRYFGYSNGQPYFPIGHNLNWSFDAIGGLETYDQWLRDLANAGGNYARLYIDVPWFINLEWEGDVGFYMAAQDKAAMLDLVLERAADYGVQLQLVLLWHQALRTYNGPPVIVPDNIPRPDVGADWDDNPYNILNGGVLSGPSVFFFDDVAQEFFRQRLRYIVARWGYSPQIFAWEIIDRIDNTANFDPAVSGPWLQGITSYLRQIDQHDHLITAGSRDYQSIVAENALLDFASAQFYQRLPIESTGDQVTGVVDVISSYLEAGFTPVLLADYSLNPWFEPIEADPMGVHFQNTLWAAALSGASGSAMSDWWDTYIIPQGLSRYYAPLAAFTAGIDWPNLNLQPAQAGLLLNTDDEEPLSYAPVRVSNFRRQFATRATDSVTRIITADGVFPSIETTPSFLYGQVFNNQFRQAQRYQVAPPVDTYLEIAIAAVSTQSGAQFIVEIDGQRAVQLNLRAGNRDVAIRIPLSAGEHTIVLDNLGEDWLELDYIEVGQLVAPARVLTLRDSEAGVALAWLQHRDYTWEKVAEGVERTPLSFEYRLDGLPAGRYVAEIWEPLEGAVLGEEILRVGEDGVLAFDLLPLDRQLAIRAVRQPATPTPTATTVPSATPVPTATRTPSPTRTITASATFTATRVPADTATASPTIRVRRTPTRIATEPSPLPTLLPFVPNTNTPRPQISQTAEATDSD